MASRSRSPTPLVGRVIARGLADDHADRHSLIVDATDERIHDVAIGRGEAIEPLRTGAIIGIEPRFAGCGWSIAPSPRPSPRVTDVTISTRISGTI